MADEPPDLPSTELEANAAELYDHAPCAYLSTRPDGLILRINQTLLDWLGASREAVMGQARFQGLLSVGSRIYYETHCAPLLHMQGFVNAIALELRTSTGELRPVMASARHVRGNDGVVVAHRVALFDSTDRRRYEQELLLARKRAEADAAQLAATDRRKNEFIAMLAHELRNPLAPVRNAVDILRRTSHADPIVEQATAMMHRQVTQMVRLVDDLLDVTRIAEGKLELRRMPVDLASVIHHAIEMSEPLLQDKGLPLAVTLHHSPVYVHGDAVRLAQAIVNVLNNAAKFTPPNGSVSLVMERRGERVTIRIIDTGIGIDEAHLPHVFDLFVQADSSAGRKSGLGIGLTLARTLVERHDGHMSISSAGAGTGTEVQIHLPALTEIPESVSRSFPPDASGRLSASRRVLIVDDNRDSADALGLLLDVLGHVVRVAYDGIEALDAAVDFGPDIVLLDIGLPRLNGYEVAQRLRASFVRRVTIVALTGWGQDEDRRRSADAGFDFHLVKPVDLQVLSRLLDGA